jgi:hypothetical protein
MLSLITLALTTGERSTRAAVRDGNFDIALGVAEAGVHRAIAKLEALNGVAPAPFSDSTPQGSYDVTVSRSGMSWVVHSTGRAGTSTTQRARRLRVRLEAPRSFAYALFSTTSIELKNNDAVNGDVWANDSVLARQGAVLDGDVTAAQSWLHLEGSARVTGNAWAGGFNAAGSWAIRLQANAEITGWARASVSSPADPSTCGGEAQNDYQVPLETGAIIRGGLTTWGEKTGPGTANSPYVSRTCTESDVPQPIPPFAFNANNYAVPTQSFASVAAFQAWLTTNKTALEGVFYVADSAPSQSNRVDLSGAVITGDVILVSDAPIFTNGITDAPGAERIFVAVSHYTPPTASACDVNHDTSECAIHVKNGFEPSCVTASLLYATNGPVAVKNNQEMCGAIYGESILVKNNQELTYDDRIARVPGFGARTFEITLWEELNS